jgi:hypothetical protein
MSGTSSRPSDPESVATFLRGQLGIDALDVTELVPGEWSQAFAYRHGGQDFVIRISGLEEAFRKDAWVDLAWIDFWAPWSPGWRGVDIVAAAAEHFEAIELDVPNFAERVRACQIWIGLDGQAYQASKSSWGELERTAARTLEIARG